MGRLVIAHHKSYHPYKAENIERVRRDEEEARLKEAQEEGRLRLADSEARIELLRKRAGINDTKTKRRDKEDKIPEPVRLSLQEHEAQKKSDTEPSYSLMTNGHINLFADLEQAETQPSNQPKERRKKQEFEDDAETDKGYRLAPSKADRTPWYTKAKEESISQLDAPKRDRDEMRKVRQDPLKDVEASLSRLASPSNPSSSMQKKLPTELSAGPSSSNKLRDSRLSREQVERQRAAELIARRRREQAGAETPSTIISRGAYDSMYNRAEVEDATKRRKHTVPWKERVKHWDGTEGTGRHW